jgi:alpha-mannosidase
MKARPDFTFTQSSVIFYQWMENLYPDLFAKIRERIKEGRWELTGGLWLEPDCNLVSGDSWSRHLLYAQRYFKQRFGRQIRLGWNPDSFGYNWNMPQSFQNAGIDAFITQKIGWNDTNVFPHRVFWWEGPDGSRVLVYFPFDYVEDITDGLRLVDRLRQFDGNTGFTKQLVLYGIGDHGGGPSLEMLQRADRLKNLDIFPAVEYGTAEKYLAWLRQQDLKNIPVWKDELYLEFHRGTYTTQANTKKGNRESEILLTNAEKFSSAAAWSGRPYNNAVLEEAWKTTLFNQFHDILPGSSIRQVYVDAAEDYQQVALQGRHELSGSLQDIAKNANTSALIGGQPMVVFNPLSWSRSDLATVALPPDDRNDYAVFDEKGKEVPSQAVSRDQFQRDLIFVAADVPAFGYKTFLLKKQKPAAPPAGLSASVATLENEFYRVAISPDSGWVKSIFDKRSNKEVLAGSGNRLQFFRDEPKEYDAWELNLIGDEMPTKFRKMEVVENGTVRAVVRMYRDFQYPGRYHQFPTEDFPNSFFTQDVILYRGIPRVEFRTGVEWWENQVTCKVAFPVTVKDTMSTYEIASGTIRRTTQRRTPWEKARHEVSAHKWADLSAKDFGVSLLNRAKYGYDIKDNVMRLTLLRSPMEPDPTADRGNHQIEYALYPHAGTWKEGNTVQAGYEYNYPLLVMLTDCHSGTLPASHSFAQLTPACLVLTSLKKAEDAPEAWIFQWYDSQGDGAEAVLRLAKAPKKAVLCNFLEEDGSPLAVDKNTLKVKTGKSSIVTIKVYF